VLEFLARRAAISVVTLFVISMIVFTGVRMIPGDPARVMAGTDADEAMFCGDRRAAIVSERGERR